MDFLSPSSSSSSSSSLFSAPALAPPPSQGASDDIDEYREAFAYFDGDRDGRLTGAELEQALAALGHALTRAELAALRRGIERSYGGSLSFAHFIKVVSTLVEPRAAQSQARAPAVRAALRGFNAIYRRGGAALEAAAVSAAAVAEAAAAVTAARLSAATASASSTASASASFAHRLRPAPGAGAGSALSAANARLLEAETAAAAAAAAARAHEIEQATSVSVADLHTMLCRHGDALANDDVLQLLKAVRPRQPGSGSLATPATGGVAPGARVVVFLPSSARGGGRGRGGGGVQGGDAMAAGQMRVDIEAVTELVLRPGAGGPAAREVARF